MYTKPADSTKGSRVFISHGARFVLCRRIEPRKRCGICYHYGKGKGWRCRSIFGEIDWAARRHMRGPICFAFPLPYNSGGGRIPLPTIHNILNSEKQEMSLILQ